MYDYETVQERVDPQTRSVGNDKPNLHLRILSVPVMDAYIIHAIAVKSKGTKTTIV